MLALGVTDTPECMPNAPRLGRQVWGPTQAKLSASLVLAGWHGRRARSEWVPGRGRRKFQIADIGTKPKTDPGANWNDDNVVEG